MKRAIGLIAATLLSTSVYSQDYRGSSNTDPNSTPDYRSRQTESGSPPAGDSGINPGGYDRAPGLSGGNSSTGQSNGSNIGPTESQDQSLTTRDSDLPGSQYQGVPQNEGSSGAFVNGSDSSKSSGAETTVKGNGSADGAFHEPAAPVREGEKSEGWSGSGTFSGAGPGSVSGSGSSTSQSNEDASSSSGTPMPIPEQEIFDSDVSNNATLNRPDEDFRGQQLRLSGDQTPMSDSLNMSESDNYANDLYRRMQKDWSTRLGTDVPYAPNGMERTVNEIGNSLYYNESTESTIGAPGMSVSGSESSDGPNCEPKGSAGEFERGYRDDQSDLDGSVRGSGTAIESDQRLQESSGAPGANVSGSATSFDDTHSLRSSGTAVDHDERLDREQNRYHINRDEDDKYHTNREASGERSSGTGPVEFGDRPTNENYDDGHLNGNNAAGSSGPVESSKDADLSPGRPQGGDENSATVPE